MMIDIDMCRVNKLLKKAKDNNYLSGFDFSLLIQDLTISEGGYVLPTGNYENVNAEVALFFLSFLACLALSLAFQ